MQKSHYSRSRPPKRSDLMKNMRITKARRLFASLKKGQRVLDMGCGNGAVLKDFTKDYDIHGVDISPLFVKQANKVGLKAKVHDLEKKPLPYQDKYFDVVFTSETMEHVVDTDWFLSEINRVLKKRGVLILTMPNIRTLVSLLMMLLLDRPPQFSARYGSPHYRDFTYKTLRTALNNHYFEIQKAVGSDFYIPYFLNFGAGLAEFFPSWAKQIIVLARKTKDSIYQPEKVFKFDLKDSDQD